MERTSSIQNFCKEEQQIFAMTTNRCTIFIICLSLVLVTSCRSTATKAPKTLRLALERAPNPNHVPLFVGHRLGYFTEVGIHLEIDKASGLESLHDLDKGHFDCAVSHLPRVLRAVGNTSDYVVVGKLVDQPLNGFLILQESGIKTLEDFNGKVLGFCSVHSSSSTSEVLLSERDIIPGCKLNVGIDCLSSLVTKKIDVFYGALKNIEVEHLALLGLKTRFFSVTDFGMPDYEELVFVMRGASLKDKKLLKGFQKALQKSIDFCLLKPEVAFGIYLEMHPDKNQRMVQWEEKSWRETVKVLARSQEFSYNKMHRLSDWLQEKDLMSKTVPIDPHFCSLVRQTNIAGNEK